MDKKFYIVNKTAHKAEILIYGYIGDFDVSANAFVKELKGLEAAYNKIDVRVNSGGGGVFDGIAIYNAIKNSTAEINTYIDGLAASMASIIALAGNRVYMSRNASMMTHKPSTYATGNSEDLKRNARLLDELENTAATIYAEKTGKSEDECKATYMNGRDNWFTAQQAMDEGLVDELYDLAPVKIASKARNEIMAYQEYAMQLSQTDPEFPNNYFITQKNKMEKYELTAEQLAKLNLKPEAGFADAASAFDSIVAKAAKANQLTQELATLRKEKEDVEAAYDNYKACEETAKINALLEDANKAGKISVNQKVKLAAKYAGDYEGLKELVDTMEAYTPVTATLGLAAHDKAELATLMAMDGKELFVNNKFERLKELDPEAFRQKWEAYIK